MAKANLTITNSGWFPKVVGIMFAILTLSVLFGKTKTDRRFKKKVPSNMLSQDVKDMGFTEEAIDVVDGALKIKKNQRIQTNGAIVERKFDGISYYHCSATEGQPALNVYNIVLLHGAKFTKDDWKKSGILERLCLYKRVNVLAVDLPVQATFDSLLPLMKGLAQKGITKLPLDALVTPSASGKTILTAIKSGNADLISKVVTKLWIPIACQVSSLTAAQLRKVKDAQLLSIWSMHGTQDQMGKESSLKLHNEAGAEISEFPGAHSFYLSLPDEFTDAVIKKLAVEN